MTGLIVIDESGDLGSSGTKYFSVAALIVLRPRYLKKAADLLPNHEEHKWHNSTPSFRKEILSAMSDLDFRLVYTVVDKNNPLDHHPIYGNRLYETVLRQVISDAMDVLPCRDTNVFLDSCSFVSISRFREIVKEEAAKHNVNIKLIAKIQSQQNKCVQLVDFIVGGCKAYCEFGDGTINVIGSKVSVARRR